MTLTLMVPMDGFHWNQRPHPILCFYAMLTTGDNKLYHPSLTYCFIIITIKNQKTLVLYHSTDFIGYGYAELEHGCIIFHHAEALENKFEHGIKMVKVNPVSSVGRIW